MNEPSPFQPVYVFLVALAGGAIVIAGGLFAYTTLFQAISNLA